MPTSFGALSSDQMSLNWKIRVVFAQADLIYAMFFMLCFIFVDF